MFRERSREYQEHFGDISKGMKGHIAIFSMGFQESFSRLGVSGAFLFRLVGKCQVILKGVDDCFRVLQRVSEAFQRVPGMF